MNQAEVLVVGAGPAGLAVAACLKKAGVEYLLLEKESGAAPVWRKQYERLRLHTPRSISSLPHLPFNSTVPRYPSLKDFTHYLDGYCAAFGIRPVCRTEVQSAARNKNQWLLQTTNGKFQSRFLVLATGLNQQPRSFRPPGVESFPGRILHSMDYRSARDFSDRKVLVVGFGNSAGEIAADLCAGGINPVMAVRSPVNVIPLNLLGIPVLHWARWLSVFPGRVSDRISAPLRRMAMGDLGATGLRQAPYGPAEQVARFGKIPLIDTGTIRLVREGKIRIAGGVGSISGSRVFFTGGESDSFDDIIAATGYHSRWPEIVGVSAERLSDLRMPLRKQVSFGADALYGCGFRASGTGMIRAIGTEARQIAAQIAHRRKQPLIPAAP